MRRPHMDPYFGFMGPMYEEFGRPPVRPRKRKGLHRHVGRTKHGDHPRARAGVSYVGTKRGGDPLTPAGAGKRANTHTPPSFTFSARHGGSGRSAGKRKAAGGDGGDKRRRLSPRELFPGGGSSAGASLSRAPATEPALSALVAVVAGVAASCVLLVRHTRASFSCNTYGTHRAARDDPSSSSDETAL